MMIYSTLNLTWRKYSECETSTSDVNSLLIIIIIMVFKLTNKPADDYNKAYSLQLLPPFICHYDFGVRFIDKIWSFSAG